MDQILEQKIQLIFRLLSWKKQRRNNYPGSYKAHFYNFQRHAAKCIDLLCLSLSMERWTEVRGSVSSPGSPFVGRTETLDWNPWPVDSRDSDEKLDVCSGANRSASLKAQSPQIQIETTIIYTPEDCCEYCDNICIEHHAWLIHSKNPVNVRCCYKAN